MISSFGQAEAGTDQGQLHSRRRDDAGDVFDPGSQRDADTELADAWAMVRAITA